MTIDLKELRREADDALLDEVDEWQREHIEAIHCAEEAEAEVATLRQERDAFAAQAVELRRVLEMVEWSSRHAAGNQYCPWCGYDEGVDTWTDQKEHMASCPRQRILSQPLPAAAERVWRIMQAAEAWLVAHDATLMAAKERGADCQVEAVREHVAKEALRAALRPASEEKDDA